ncbi:NADH dehydrogenase [ubiquinone] iron-sulfur protein 6, mitochondrial isoform X3 [Pleurodeles waltl]|uniref:NADH dehydrogenase [ubiquinone] iron-sulfur protein 6, mitochondrial isoform X3 n=1 Tax=Pleurodeles waltl TaxID=8319 RepID=UPI0037099328
MKDVQRETAFEDSDIGKRVNEASYRSIFNSRRTVSKGSAFDADDYRKVRFVARQKEVNEQFAIDLIKEQPVSEVDSRVVSCDGGGGALGHPKVFINLDKDTKTGTCGYCGLQFKKHPHH